jgi:hypothetical protein
MKSFFKKCLCGAVLAAVQPLFGQSSTISHQTFATVNPNPLFLWDLTAQRVGSVPGGVGLWGLDLNRDSVAEFTFVSSEATHFYVLPAGVNAVLSIGSGAKPLDSLAPIVPNPADGTWAQRIDSPVGSAGPTFVLSSDIGAGGSFYGIESAYIGLQFTLADGTHYGWARVGCPVQGLGYGWIYETAYETRPDTPILTSAIPEPSTLGLMAAAALISSFLAFRRRI